ncbi:MAG: bifunctional DNA-binding transcriptional regulator/O6-methylguanine-DNA methyltransferase Ada [bacterium]|nr:bifunctional DNA-binding transcriptional regulator/O6-methylguanine-DNA methyltransferase Ada [bacterium]
MNDDQRWQAVTGRDAQADAQFVYAVKTTRIYCRPSCPSRRPHRENVVFYATNAEAENAGYRPCRRCTPHVSARTEPQLDRIVSICRYLETLEGDIPTLQNLSERFALSPFHLQRAFKRIVGVSPRQYADAVRQGRLKAFLKEESTVTEAVYAAGYQTSSRMYAQAPDMLGMTPIHYREGGKTMDITYITAQTRLGVLLVAATERGICSISLGHDETALIDALRDEFPAAALHHGDDGLSQWVNLLIAYADGERVTLDLPLDIQATGFQRKVWEALRAIPYGETRSYTEIAAIIGQPTAARAVAQACASNPAALAIPCHRVVRGDGSLSGYRWGIDRKRALLEQERAAS